jgi:hypothetical protein
MTIIQNISLSISFNFIPIHTFVPRLQKNGYKDVSPSNVLIDPNDYGKERYIALSNGISNNYID